MEWVNYHHLFYFWVVAREGGILPAARVLRLSHPTISTQVRALEDSLGDKLFTKVGRKLQLTEMGQVVYRYADEIFTLGREMVDTVKGRATGQPHRLSIGIADVVPKMIVLRLLEPAIQSPEPVRLVCYEDGHDKLLAELALHNLHLVISDSPVPSGSPIRAFNHLLGETGVSLFGSRALVSKYRRGFPGSLHGAPFLLPLENLPLRRALNQWFSRHSVVPQVVAEFEDSALLKVFGAEGLGFFPAPSAVQREVVQQFGVQRLGQCEGVKERFYVITAERRLTHPAVKTISESARLELFGDESP